MRELKNRNERPVATPFDQTIPTGWLTAYGRTFTDIPYAREIYDELKTLKSASGFGEALENMEDASIAPRFEARHLLLSRLIERTGITQVLEVAAGLSTRGLVMTSHDEFRYAELDLPGMMKDKRETLSAMGAKGIVTQRPNLHIEDGSAVEPGDLESAARHFDADKPLVVADEGLLRYLSSDDKAAYAGGVKALLARFGGVWITSEALPNVSYQDRDVTAALRDRVSDTIGASATGNLFGGENTAMKFFSDAGFSAEAHSLLEVTDDLASPGNLNLSPDYVRAINASAACFVLNPMGRE